MQLPAMRRVMLGAAVAVLLVFLALVFLVLIEREVHIALNAITLDGEDVFLFPPTNHIRFFPIAEGLHSMELRDAWMKIVVPLGAPKGDRSGWKETQDEQYVY